MIRRTTAIAAVTWTELVRLKVFYFLVIFALLVIGNSFFLARFSFEEEFQMLKDIALGAMSIFSSLLAILATATLLPKDMEDRTIYTILAKPVSRVEYLLGKLAWGRSPPLCSPCARRPCSIRPRPKWRGYPPRRCRARWIKFVRPDAIQTFSLAAWLSSSKRGSSPP
jgi:hypothetical protein